MGLWGPSRPLGPWGRRDCWMKGRGRGGKEALLGTHPFPFLLAPNPGHRFTSFRKPWRSLHELSHALLLCACVYLPLCGIQSCPRESNGIRLGASGTGLYLFCQSRDSRGQSYVSPFRQGAPTEIAGAVSSLGLRVRGAAQAKCGFILPCAWGH
jgi:hypothetical protein